MRLSFFAHDMIFSTEKLNNREINLKKEFSDLSGQKNQQAKLI